MCPTFPVSFLQALSDHPDVPEEIKVTFKPSLERSLATEQASKELRVAKKQTTNNSKFTFSLYSMHNKTSKEFAHDELLWDSHGLKVQGTDAARDKCHAAFEQTWKLFNECFHRNSLDNKGIEMVGSIHYKQGVADAQWDTAAGQMFFGDGGIFDDENDDGRRVTDLATFTIDVVGHELTHGVVSFEAPGIDPQLRKSPPTISPDATVMPPYLADFQKTLINLSTETAEQYKTMTPSGLEYLWLMARKVEAWTLNEHIADCFGIMTKHYSQKKSAQEASWNIGDGWWTSETMSKNGWGTANYQRTFLDPASGTTQPDIGPKKWNDQITFLVQDPHIFMGIPNHAFYVAATKEFGGNTWDNVGKIWYDALTDPEFKKPANQTFKGWRDLTIKHAGLHFPTTEGTKKMTNAWHAVNL